jgi:hypothetical protein
VEDLAQGPQIELWPLALDNAPTLQALPGTFVSTAYSPDADGCDAPARIFPK